MKRIPLLLIASFLVSTFLYGSLLAFAEDDEDHGGDIIYTKPLKAVIFSHKAHTVDIGLECDWCHEETFEMEALHMQESTDFTMVSLCNEVYCGTCHNGDVAFSTTTQCARCHIGVKGYNELVRQGVIEPEEGEEIPAAEGKSGH
jgi:c(7)-type cytochrome triheme protein